MSSIVHFSALIFATATWAGPITPLRRSVSCPPGFRNVVFNGPATSQPDWPGRFKFIQSFGFDKWIGFMDMPNTGDPNLDNHLLRVAVNGDDIVNAIPQLSSANPPEFLELLNEPDIGLYGNPKLDPAQAAAAVAPMLAVPNPHTKFLSPALAITPSDYLHQFFAACNCLDRFPIISVHVYDPNPQNVISWVQTFVLNAFPGKKVWITEIAPACNTNFDCSLTEDQVIDWMFTVLGWMAAQPAIERIFWNTGEWGPVYPGDPEKCNPSLTNLDGSARPLLTAFKQLCAY